MSRQQMLLNSIDALKRKASDYAKTDRIGRVLATSFDLIGGAARDGVEAPSVRDLTEWLGRDTEFAKEKDNKDVVPPTHIPRELVYGLLESLGPMLDEIAERKTEEIMHLKAQIDLLTKQSLQGGASIDHSVGEPARQDTMPMEIAEMDHSVKEELNDEMGELTGNNYFMVLPKDEENDALFDAGFMDRLVHSGQGEKGGEEPTNDQVNGNDEEEDREKEENEEEEKEHAGTCAPQLKRRRVSVQKLSGGSSSTPGLKRNHFCDICQYAALRPCELTIHKRTHTGERPFKCTFDNVCEMTFASKSNLYQHIRKNHQENKMNKK